MFKRHCEDCGTVNPDEIDNCWCAESWEEPSAPVTGGPAQYYDFPEGAITLNDLIEHKEMDFHRGNIFKACWRLGTKEGTTEEYDMRKIIYSGLRMLKKSEGVEEVQRYLKELSDERQFNE